MSCGAVSDLPCRLDDQPGGWIKHPDQIHRRANIVAEHPAARFPSPAERAQPPVNLRWSRFQENPSNARMVQSGDGGRVGTRHGSPRGLIYCVSIHQAESDR
jgi:hypothetical protein